MSTVSLLSPNANSASTLFAFGVNLLGLVFLLIRQVGLKEQLSQLIGEQELRDLYETQLLSETEIASRLQIPQVYVGRLRKRYGIPTLSKAQRALQRFPPLTDRQRELVFGSLLGDGSLSATSDTSARYSEYHSESQAEYADWKADILGPLVSDRGWTEKRDVQSGKLFRGRVFRTMSCPQFRETYDLFYPPPLRKRVFPANLPELMTPFMLAVWYMDDGSVNNGRNPRIAFGLDDLSLRRAFQALRKLGLKPKVYGEGGRRSIEFMGQTRLFLDLVQPHVPECMLYKLPVETLRQETDRRARRLTPDLTTEMLHRGLSVREISAMFGVGISTVRRRARGSVSRKGEVSRERAEAILESQYPDTSLWRDQDEKTQGEWVDEVVSLLSQVGFPYPHKPSDKTRDRVLKNLESRGTELDRSPLGLKLCYPFFPNRYRARYLNRRSALESWFDADFLRRAVRWQFKAGDPVTPGRVLLAVCANARTPTVFRPAVAAALYKRYCQPGDTVWDPCAGFGGRLLGAVAAGVRYIGTDVAPDTVEGNRALAEWLGVQDAEVHLVSAETFQAPSVQMVMTSPPYYRQERYEGGEQSWATHVSFESWREGFLTPMIRRGVEALTSGGYWVLNIADVRDGGVTYPLVETAREAFRSMGLEEVETLKMPLSNLNRRAGGEPVLVWRKP